MLNMWRASPFCSCLFWQNQNWETKKKNQNLLVFVQVHNDWPTLASFSDLRHKLFSPDPQHRSNWFLTCFLFQLFQPQFPERKSMSLQKYLTNFWKGMPKSLWRKIQTDLHAHCQPCTLVKDHSGSYESIMTWYSHYITIIKSYNHIYHTIQADITYSPAKFQCAFT